jgi:hypothetical protein
MIWLINMSQAAFSQIEQVSIVDLTVANAVLLATRSGASKTDICDRQIHTVASKTAFATVKSTIDTSNSSITVLLFLFF